VKNFLKKPSIVYLTVFLLFNSSFAVCKSVQEQTDNKEIEFNFDPYYTSLDYYLPLTETAIPHLRETDELTIYKKMIASPKLRFLIFELSTYPMPCLGALMLKQFPEFYDSLTLSENVNVVKSLTAGFEEPYAASIFLGDVVSFKPETGKNEEGKGYTGILASFGDYHIKDNELIYDKWLECELKVKGDKTNSENKMSWDARAGTKLHGNKYIKNVVYFAFKRDRTDYNTRSSSIFKNSSIEYTIDFDATKMGMIEHYFLVGKKFPLKNSKIVFSLATGLIWEGEDKYSGPLKRTDKSENLQILFRPNIEF